jgi:protein-tyrosine kinase
MSKIYEALRRHEKTSTRLQDLPSQSRGPIVRALESVYPVVYRMSKEAGRGLVLHFVAASAGEGTSTLSSEFALVAAQVSDARVLLVDADRTNFTTAMKFGCPTTLGIFDQLQAQGGLEQHVVEAPGAPRLRVGVLSGQNSPPVARKSVPLLYEQFRAKYDVTIIDCPAVFSDRYFDLCPEAADGVFLVVQAERSRPEIIRQAQSLVENAGGKFVGAILNRRHTYIPAWLYRLL